MARISGVDLPPSKRIEIGLTYIFGIGRTRALHLLEKARVDREIKVKDLTVAEIQAKVQSALADGYMKYPVVVVSLQESRSRRFFVYGEVVKPGTYLIAENTTVLRAISMASSIFSWSVV